MSNKEKPALSRHCTKQEAFGLISSALAAQDVAMIRRLALECHDRHFLLSREEKMKLSVACAVAADPMGGEDTQLKAQHCRLWQEATKNLPQDHYFDAVNYAMQLVFILMKLNQHERAYSACDLAKPFLMPGATQYVYDVGRQELAAAIAHPAHAYRQVIRLPQK